MTETMKAIRRELALRNITQREFADITGFSECTISRWLSGHRTPKINDVEVMVEALGLRIELMRGNKMTREEREAAIAHIKGYRKLDEVLHNTAPKDSISYYATDKCLKYWDMAIQALEKESIYDDKEHYVTISKALYDKLNIDYEALSQELCEDTVSRGVFEQVMWERDVAIDQLKELGYSLGQKIEPCEEAISIPKDVLKTRVGNIVAYNVEWLKKHWQMEMDIVCGVKPCEDAISREDVMDWLENATYEDVCEAVGTTLDFLPSVTPSRPKGHWINVNEGKWNTIPAYKCSACGENADLCDWSGKSPFCPWCGAEMESEE